VDFQDEYYDFGLLGLAFDNALLTEDITMYETLEVRTFNIN